LITLAVKTFLEWRLKSDLSEIKSDS